MWLLFYIVVTVGYDEFLLAGVRLKVGYLGNGSLPVVGRFGNEAEAF